MARYAERAAADYLTGQEIVEQLGAWLGGLFTGLETTLLEEIARRVARDLPIDDQRRRADTIRELEAAAREALDAINTEELARRVVQTAIVEGEAAAIEQIGFTQAARGGVATAIAADGTPLPFATGITPNSATAAAAIGLDLTNALQDVRARILRAVPDLYQTTVARFSAERVLGVVTRRSTQSRTIAAFLGQGLTGFTDRAGRNWQIGSYVEMATRTATNRAWLEAHQQRWASMGLHLVTIVRGLDSCRRCAEWSGRVLSTNGVTGTVTAAHATTGEPVDIVIHGTIDQARAGGWNHPNCRCTLAPVFPGLSLPANDSTYDPEAEKARDRLRALEREVRAAKRQAAIAEGMGDEVAAAAYRAQARDAQRRIREHVAETGQLRKPYRESLSWSGDQPRGGGARPVPVTSPTPTPFPRDVIDRGGYLDTRGYGAFDRDGYGAHAGYSDDEQRAIADYTAPSYARYLNGTLRGGADPNLSYLSGQANLADTIRLLDSATSTGRITADGILYRGVQMTDELLAQYQLGGVFRDAGFVSTAADPRMAERFRNSAGESGWMLEIAVRAGQTAAPGYGGLTEVILPRDTAFNVLGIDPETRTITLEIQ